MAVRASNKPENRKPLAYAADLTFHLENARRCADAIARRADDPGARGTAEKMETILQRLKRGSRQLESDLVA